MNTQQHQTATSAQDTPSSTNAELLIHPVRSSTENEASLSVKLVSRSSPTSPISSSRRELNKNKENVQVDQHRKVLLPQVASADLLGIGPTHTTNDKEAEKQDRHHQQQQHEFLVAHAETDRQGSHSSPNTSPTSSANRAHASQASTPTNKRPARKNLTDSGVESSLQTSSNRGEAQRLLNSCEGSCCVHHRRFGAANPAGHLRAMDQANKQKQANEMSSSSSSLKEQTIRLLPAYFAAELMGTFLLVLIGDGALGSYVFDKKPADAFNVCIAFGAGAMIAAYVSSKISGAHTNPAATFAFALNGKLKWRLVPVYWTAQYMGGFLAALVLFLNNSEAINSLDGGVRSTFGSNHSTGNVFATYPAPFLSLWGSLIDQIVGTAVLLFSLSAVGDKLNSGLEERFQPFAVAVVVGFTCWAFNVNCGAIFNPARDLAPRLMTALVGYPGVWSPLGGAYWVVTGVVATHIGAIVGVFGYKYLISKSLEARQRHLRAINADSHDGSDGEAGKLDLATKPGRLPECHLHHHHHQQYQHNESHLQHFHDGTATPTHQGPRRLAEVADYGAAVTR